MLHRLCHFSSGMRRREVRPEGPAVLRGCSLRPEWVQYVLRGKDSDQVLGRQARLQWLLQWGALQHVGLVLLQTAEHLCVRRLRELYAYTLVSTIALASSYATAIHQRPGPGNQPLRSLVAIHPQQWSREKTIEKRTAFSTCTMNDP